MEKQKGRLPEDFGISALIERVHLPVKRGSWRRSALGREGPPRCPYGSRRGTGSLRQSLALLAGLFLTLWHRKTKGDLHGLDLSLQGGTVTHLEAQGLLVRRQRFLVGPFQS